jgi:glycosyltransferase involved in cell wall biosynthesis
MSTAPTSLARSALSTYRRRRAREAQLHPRLAFYSPMPPAATGVASYSAAVLEGLRRTGFTERHTMDVVWPIEPKDEGLVRWRRLGIYQLGNNIGFHRDIYRFACLAPGLAVLHDLALDDFVRGLKANGDPLGYVAEREAAAGRSRLHDLDALRNAPLREPWVSHVVRRSRGVIVHSAFGARYLNDIGCRTPVFVVPHPVVGSEMAIRTAGARADEMRARAGAGPNDVLVVAPGDLNQAKQLGALVAAAGGLDVRVALVGRRIEGFDADALVATAGLGERLTLAADVSDEDFLAWLSAADIVVDLRFPHRGETSGSLARAMQVGRASIVSATGAYLDLPDDSVLRIPGGPADPSALAARIRELAEDPDRRARMGAAAREHIARLRTSEATAHGYADAIGSTLDLVRDPARKAYARWAGALADLGVDESTLSRGYGLPYARAMETFREL